MAWSERLIVVIPANRQAALNNAAKHVDWDEQGGDKTFTVGLSATGNAPATHYWAALSAMPTMVAGIMGRLRGGGAPAAEAAAIPRSGTLAANRINVCREADWDAEDVLSALGLKRVGTVR